MKEQIVIVTEPDDINFDGFRLLAVDLMPDQSQIISSILLNTSLLNKVIVYNWNSNNDVNWLLDKKQKSDLIIFNADSYNDIIVGYLSAQRNSCYFGNLKLLTGVNNLRIYGYDDCQKLLTHHLEKYG